MPIVKTWKNCLSCEEEGRKAYGRKPAIRRYPSEDDDERSRPFWCDDHWAECLAPECEEEGPILYAWGPYGSTDSGASEAAKAAAWECGPVMIPWGHDWPTAHVCDNSQCWSDYDMHETEQGWDRWGRSDFEDAIIKAHPWADSVDLSPEALDGLFERYEGWDWVEMNSDGGYFDHAIRRVILELTIADILHAADPVECDDDSAWDYGTRRSLRIAQDAIRDGVKATMIRCGGDTMAEDQRNAIIRGELEGWSEDRQGPSLEWNDSDGRMIIRSGLE